MKFLCVPQKKEEDDDDEEEEYGVKREGCRSERDVVAIEVSVWLWEGDEMFGRTPKNKGRRKGGL